MPAAVSDDPTARRYARTAEIRWANGRTDVDAPEGPARATRELVFDTRRGWPPRLLEGRNVRPVASFSAPQHFTLADQRANLRAALADRGVRELLIGRWEVLGCNLVSSHATADEGRVRVRASLFNYTTNCLVEVELADGAPISVRVGGPHEYPESPIEMAQAIGVARRSDELRDRVGELDAHAILQIPPDPHEPSFGHRCMLVMFTERNDPRRELPVLFAAMVDLRLQRVLAAGICPCDFDIRPAKKKAR